MPVFAWLVKDDVSGSVNMSRPLPHTCFAQVPGFAMRSLCGWGGTCHKAPEHPFILYAACNGTFEDAQLYADKVNESILITYGFTLTAHKYDTEDNPFADKRFNGVSCPAQYGNTQKVSYWSIEWPMGALWDLVYAVTKLIFKNITYGNRETYGNTFSEMMRILREGGNVFEAMVYCSQYTGNGYGYPLRYHNVEQAKAVYKFTQEGPTFFDWDVHGAKLGDGETVNTSGWHTPIYNANGWNGGAPFKKSYGGIKQMGVPLSKLRADLLEAAAGVTNVSL